MKSGDIVLIFRDHNMASASTSTHASLDCTSADTRGSCHARVSSRPNNRNDNNNNKPPNPSCPLGSLNSALFSQAILRLQGEAVPVCGATFTCICFFSANHPSILIIVVIVVDVHVFCVDAQKAHSMQKQTVGRTLVISTLEDINHLPALTHLVYAPL